MDLATVFYLLKENEKIDKEKLSGCGVDDEFISFALKEGIFVQTSESEFVAGDVDTLVDFGRFIMEKRNFKIANSIFNCAYDMDPDNFNINYQLFYMAISDYKLKRSRVYKYFNSVYKSLVDSGNLSLANYYLFLIGNICGFDSKIENTGYCKEYNRKFLDLEEGDILIPNVDEFSYHENILRKKVFSNSYHDVSSTVDQRFTARNDLSFEDMIEKELLLKWLKRKRDFNESLANSLNKSTMENTKLLLDNEDERRGLTMTNEYILMIVNSYITIQNTGIIPTSKYNGDDTFKAIAGNNYKLAMTLEENRMKKYNVKKESNMHIALTKIEELIVSKKGVSEDIKVQIKDVSFGDSKDENTQSVVEKPIEDYTLSDSDIQKIDYKVEKMRAGRMLYLLEPMPQEKRHAIREYIKDNYGEDISTFSLGNEPERRVVLRYKPLIKEHINIKEVLDEAKAYYASKDYDYAAEYYELALKIGVPRATTYSGYAMTLYRQRKIKEAIDCMKIATIMSKTTGRGDIDFSNMIEILENPPTVENRKPNAVVKESEFEDKNESSLNDEIVNDIVGLINEGDITLEAACTRLGLNEDDTNYVKLVYARDCYYIGDNTKGDKYFKQVEKKKKSYRVKELYKEILINKKYYHNRYDENSNQLIFIKK